MNRPPVEQIRRLALAGLVVVTLVIAGSYGLRRWRAYQARRSVPTNIPVDVQQQTEKFTFSRSEQGRTLFTVQAARTVERTGKTAHLEDVTVSIYGRQGERGDEIRTARCDYDLGGAGTILCPEEVTVRLGGSPPSGGATRSIELTTRALQFDPAQGVAWTDQPVRFSFAQGAGEAVGLRYQPSEPRVLLEGQVAIRVGRGAGAPVRIRGTQLRYYAAAQAFELVPPLALEVGDRALRADQVRMELDENFRTRRIEATGNVQVRGQQDGRQLSMRAAQAVATYGSDGRIEHLWASRQVEFESQGGDAREQLTCQEALFEFEAARRSIERIVATGQAYLVSSTAQETRELRAPVVELALRAGGRQQQRLTAGQRGTLRLHRQSGEQHTVVGDRLQLQFEAKQRLRSLTASGAVEMKETRPESPERTTRSDELRARFDAEGKLFEAEQWGQFRYEGGRWRAEAGRAQYRAATETLVLREQPVLWDATTRTHAKVIEVSEKSGILRAEGEVRTARQPVVGALGGFGTGGPLQLAAERLQAEPHRGWARYEGQARLWQGENRLAAAALELLGAPGRLVAEGNVSALFVEASGEGKTAEKAVPSSSPHVVSVTAARFTYGEAERRGLFEGRVTARNAFGTLTAPRLEVFLAVGEGANRQRVERVHARGGVRIEQAGARALSEDAEYRAGAQTVVLWGGAPTISDAQRGTTTGARLTLFLADGRILIESAEGTRTITRRLWTQ